MDNLLRHVTGITLHCVVKFQLDGDSYSSLSSSPSSSHSTYTVDGLMVSESCTFHLFHKYLIPLDSYADIIWQKAAISEALLSPLSYTF